MSALYEFSTYSFSTDLAFQVQNLPLVYGLGSFLTQEGLHSVVSDAQGKSREELENVIEQAKLFYFTRTTGHKITWEEYVEWKRSHPSPFPSAPVDTVGETPTIEESEESSTPQELTFQQITELIQSGKAHLIPNNKVIPEALHPDPPSELSRPARKKPWERSEAGEEETVPNV